MGKEDHDEITVSAGDANAAVPRTDYVDEKHGDHDEVGIATPTDGCGVHD